MRKQMDEEAQLYWKDIQVLDHARNRMVEFLQAVWSKASETMKDKWKAGELTATSDMRPPEKDREVPGGWTLLPPERGKSLPQFQVWIHDPRKSKRPPHYEVCLVCSKTTQQKILRNLSNGMATFEATAREYGIEALDWDASSQIWTDTVKLVSDDSDATGEQVAEVAYRLLCMIVQFQNRMLPQSRKEAPEA